MIKTESTRKLSNFNFQWTKTLYQNNLKWFPFFFYFAVMSRARQEKIIQAKLKLNFI